MSKTILVVDDSKAMRLIVRRTLRQAGFGEYEVEEAANGVEALERIGQAAPALVISDWNMPEMNGIDLILALRLDRNYDRMLVMMVTTETEMSQVQRAMSAGANEYVMKPFSEDVLGDKLTLLGFEDHG